MVIYEAITCGHVKQREEVIMVGKEFVSLPMLKL